MAVTIKLSDWETKQIESIKFLLKQAIEAIDDFTKKDNSLQNADLTVEGVDRSADWLKFRGIMLDLYSVLDYVWYLLYCHFLHEGQPDFSEKGCSMGFPYKKKGIKVSKSQEHDRKKNFLEDKLRMIWGNKIGEETPLWKGIGNTILSIQPKLEVDRSGTPIGDVQIQPGDEESFALLHFYRNCAAHKDLITFLPKKTWIKINQKTRGMRLVTVQERNDDSQENFYLSYDKPLYWIQLPWWFQSNFDEPGRLLTEVLDQLRKFVVNTADKLLHLAQLLPSGYELATNFNANREANSTTDMTSERSMVRTATNGNQQAEVMPDSSKWEVCDKARPILREHFKNVSTKVIEKRDLRFVVKALGKECTRNWEDIGLAAQVQGLDNIKSSFGNDVHRKLILMINAWLSGNYTPASDGSNAPSWWKIVDVVADDIGGANPREAQRIARDWKKLGEDMTYSSSSLAFKANSDNLLHYELEMIVSKLRGVLKGVSSKWFEIGIILGIDVDKLMSFKDQSIEEGHESIDQFCLKSVIKEWLSGSYCRENGFLDPSMQVLVDAVQHPIGGADPLMGDKLVQLKLPEKEGPGQSTVAEP